MRQRLIRTAWIVGIVTAACVLSGCVTRRASVNLEVFTNAIADPTQGVVVATTMQAVPTAPIAAPGSVMLIRVAAAPTELDGPRKSRSYASPRSGSNPIPLVWVVPEGMNQAQCNLARTRVRSMNMHCLSDVTALPMQMHPGAVLLEARNQCADWACVYSAESEYSSYGGNALLFLAQLPTLGLMPTTSRARCRIELVIIDLRSNTVIEHWGAEEIAWQPAVGLTLRDASQQSADRAETQALRTILDRIDRTLAATEPASARKTPKRTDGDWQK